MKAEKVKRTSYIHWNTNWKRCDWFRVVNHGIKGVRLDRCNYTLRDYVALTPLIWEHINAYGRFELDMNAHLICRSQDGGW
ncbi:MAG: transposase [Nitrosomonas sp.]|nr:transposase [Nitrosomonas sp.]